MNADGPSAPWRGGAQADTVSIALLGGGYLAIAIAAATQVGHVSWRNAVAALVLIALYVIACQTVFVRRALDATPTEPVLVGMLFLVPLGLVPLVQGLADMLSVRPDDWRPRTLVRHALLGFAHSWHCLGPLLVLAAWPVHSPDLRHWPVLLLALAAQVAFDTVTTLIRAYFMRHDYRALWAPMLWSIRIDIGLAAVGVCAVAATHRSLWGLVLIALNVALMRALSRDRVDLLESNDELDREVASARSEARVDALTGVGNRRAWLEALVLGVEYPRARPGVVLIADLNGLKRVNDTLGHAAGDALIVALADAAREIAPPDAVVCRIGGDEFGVLALRPPATEGGALAHRLQAAVAARAWPHGKTIFCVCMSTAGLALLSGFDWGALRLGR